MPLEELATVTHLPADAHIFTLAFTRNGNGLILGTHRVSGRSELLGLYWLDWTRPSAIEGFDLPPTPFEPNIDSIVGAFDIDGSAAIAFTATNSAYRPHQEVLWLVDRRGPSPRQVIHQTAGTRLSSAFSTDGTHLLIQKTDLSFEVFQLAPFRSSFTIELPTPAARVVAVGLADDLRNFAVATAESVTWYLDAGSVVGTWPAAGVHTLTFRPDSDALWAVSRQSVTTFRPSARPATLAGRALALDPRRHTALLHGSVLVEQSLTTGDVRSHGPMPADSMVHRWDLTQRRFATLEYPGGTGRIRVFQLTD